MNNIKNIMKFDHVKNEQSNKTNLNTNHYTEKPIRHK